jgi:hypothetical protein
MVDSIREKLAPFDSCDGPLAALRLYRPCGKELVRCPADPIVAVLGDPEESPVSPSLEASNPSKGSLIWMQRVTNTGTGKPVGSNRGHTTIQAQVGQDAAP